MTQTNFFSPNEPSSEADAKGDELDPTKSTPAVTREGVGVVVEEVDLPGIGKLMLPVAQCEPEPKPDLSPKPAVRTKPDKEEPKRFDDCQNPACTPASVCSSCRKRY